MISLSNRGFPMLHLFAGGAYMTYTEAHKYDQRPFRSMLIREYIAYHPGKGFRITDKGKKVWEEFTSTEIDRKNRDAHLTAVFRPEDWGLKETAKRPMAKSA